ncbi:MAG TPA: hypothetical protein VNJ52_00560 [Patescibacteria group bacterium]|nr:hypothetical protein [Patescibacteria group bacterium]
MRRTVIRVVVVAVVATCFACPILQMFDRWDHSEKRGKDTESTLLVVALSVGLAIPAAGLVFQSPGVAERKRDLAEFPLDRSLLVFARPPIPVSQPPPVLRI